MILAVEFLAAARRSTSPAAIDGSARPASHTRAVRSLVPPLDRDRFMSDDIETIAAALSRGEFIAAVENSGVELR